MKAVWPIAFSIMAALIITAGASIVFAAPPVPSVGVAQSVLTCADIQDSPTIIRFVDRSVRDAQGNIMTVVCYARTTADGNGEMDCVVK